MCKIIHPLPRRLRDRAQCGSVWVLFRKRQHKAHMGREHVCVLYSRRLFVFSLAYAAPLHLHLNRWNPTGLRLFSVTSQITQLVELAVGIVLTIISTLVVLYSRRYLK